MLNHKDKGRTVNSESQNLEGGKERINGIDLADKNKLKPTWLWSKDKN